MPSSLKATIKQIPVIGDAARALWKMLPPAPGEQPAKLFERVALPAKDREYVQAANVLAYTKTSGTGYSGREFPAGYHSIEIGQRTLKGQRIPRSRLLPVPYDFAGKSVLDIGSNQGGMLHAMDGRLAWGVGLDFEPKLVNAATRIARIRDDQTLNFYTFNLESDPLPLIEDFLPGRPDVIFLLSVCMWIENWKDVLTFLSSLSERMLFEANGTDKQQAEQIRQLDAIYSRVTLLAETSEDDPKQKKRQLLWCER